MNYLAHLHIAHHCGSELTGNLAADFIKGKPDGRFPNKTAEAIYLHRFVDRHIDLLPENKKCRHVFDKSLYRFSSIALDIFWDHILARDWDDFHPSSLEHFVKESERRCRLEQKTIAGLPEKYLTISDLMWQQEWLLSYQSFDTVSHVLQRMSVRSARMGPLALCHDVLASHYDTIAAEFAVIYPMVLNAAKNFSIRPGTTV
ncbi:ACP phosphodiesterase [Veronia pacifica]|uniref:ACP phosphodiesterase n=1 Tax=Veronia pacifica TaxID=1080227 RepID=A0A1C3EGC3_9GAMM|nr:ACP phosphodiesterase [Veronia pacifica]ODA32297.1 hypothetical protein A8L45_13285 [Veronia pacifica]